ncbi:MAG TPA: hypothetical protein VI685_13155 [Candidatus Angelobacter sp.]
MKQQTADKQKLLRRALQGNALFSMISGVAILAMNRTLVDFLGLPGNASLAVLGIGLLAYAAWLLWTATRRQIKMVDAWIAVILDMAWVVGSYALLFAVQFSSGGKWVMVAVAELVFLFGVMQWLGLRRIRVSRQPV